MFLVLIDWQQTKAFRRDGKQEANPFLGREPSQEKVDTYIALGIISHAFITYLIPTRFRPLWNTYSITLEAVAVYDNCRSGYCIGVKIGSTF